jgi:hypothetical protein
MVNPSYKTITYDATAAELDLNTWYANGPSDVNASKIIMSADLTWDIKWQIVTFAKQELIFDGNGNTITLAKDTGGAGTSPNNFRGLLCVTSSHSYLRTRPDAEDYYGIHVKNLVIDSTTNSIGLEFQNVSETNHSGNTSGIYSGCGYLFGVYHNNSYGSWGGDGRQNINSRVLPTTKNTFICEKVQVKAYFSANTDIKNWLTWKTGQPNWSYAIQRYPYQSGAFAGHISGRCKFVNCIANGRFHGYNSHGYLEFVNCLTTNNSLLSVHSLNRQSEYNGGVAHQKYIFENCVAYKLFDKFYNTATHTDITNVGTILEITGCKVEESNYWTNDPGSSSRTITNSSTGYDYLDNTSYEIKQSENNNILAVVNGDSAFIVKSGEIGLNFSPYSGIEIDDVNTVRSIDLSASDVVPSNLIPDTWFSNLGTDTIDYRRNLIATEIFNKNTNRTEFDVSKVKLQFTANTAKENTRVFKVDASTKAATVNFNSNAKLTDSTGFYVPITEDNQKVNITNKAGTITFKIERTGTDANGAAQYQVTKTGGTDNLMVNA